MKKKILSAIALTMAMTLTFGMTAFAANSSSTTNDGNTVVAESVAADIEEPTDATEKETLVTESKAAKKAIASVEADDADVEVTVDNLEAGELKNAKEVALAIAEDNCGSNSAVTVVAGANVEVSDMPEGGVTLTITLEGFTADANKDYIVLHLVNGYWVTVDATVEGSTVTAHFDSLSPIVVVEVSEKEEATNPPASDDTPATLATPAVSPKTGEVWSVAGILAVICLAGAVVSARKVRYNR